MGKRFWAGSLFVITFLVLLIPLSAIAEDTLTVKDSGGNSVFRVDSGGTVEVPGGVIWDNVNKRLGIGTASPGSDLHISKEGNINPMVTVDGSADSATAKPMILFVRSRGTHSAPAALQNGDWLGQFSLNGYNGGAGGYEGARRVFQVEASENWTPTAGGYRFNFYTRNNGTVGAPTARVTFDHNGNVGIGTTTPTHLIQLSGGAYSDGTTWVNASSREYKENITELTTSEAMDTLVKLDPVKYNYKVDKEDRHVGFIAEDVPELVATKDRKGLSPMDIVAVLTKVVQDQQKTIAELKNEMAELKKEVKLKNGFAAVGARD